jgi:hypothetical protein
MDMMTAALWLFGMWFVFWIGFVAGAWWILRQQDERPE